MGIFEKRLVITDSYGITNDHPADSLLLPLTKLPDLPDILAYAVASKYQVQDKVLIFNPAW